jgi:hypothetical protein
MTATSFSFLASLASHRAALGGNCGQSLQNFADTRVFILISRPLIEWLPNRIVISLTLGEAVDRRCKSCHVCLRRFPAITFFSLLWEEEVYRIGPEVSLKTTDGREVLGNHC